jgi:hypothetical protein
VRVAIATGGWAETAPMKLAAWREPDGIGFASSPTRTSERRSWSWPRSARCEASCRRRTRYPATAPGTSARAPSRLSVHRDRPRARSRAAFDDYMDRAAVLASLAV